MFAQSVTAHVLKRMLTLIKDSFVVSLMIKLVMRLKADFMTSRMLELLSRFVAFIQNQYHASRFKKFINSESRLHAAYQSSLLCGVVCFVFSVLTKICGIIWRPFKSFAEGGIVYSLVSKLSEQKYFSFHCIFAVLIGVMIICPHELWNNLYALVFAVGSGAWFLIRVYNKKDSAEFKNINFGLVVFLLFASLISMISDAQKDALRIMLFVYSAVIFGLLMGKLGESKEKLFQMLKIVCAAGAVTSVVGIIQGIIGVEVNPEYVDVASSGNMPGRVFSTFANPNNFAELLVLLMPLTAALVLFSDDIREKRFFAVCFVLDFAAIGMSYSRSCWVALALSLIVMIFVYDWRLLVPLIFAAIIAIPFLPESIFNRIMSIGSMSDSSNAYRLHIWTGALRVIRNYFLSGLGAGPENFKIFYRPLAEFISVTAPHSHMIYLELIIEFGIFGALGFFYYFISLMRKGFSAISKADKKMKMILAAALGSMVGMLFVCAAEYVWFYPRDMFMFWIVLGIITAATKAAATNKH